MKGSKSKISERRLEFLLNFTQNMDSSKYNTKSKMRYYDRLLTANR